MNGFQPQSILVTGGAGFIGSNFVRFLMEKTNTKRICVLDRLTYAGNKENLQAFFGDPRFTFMEGDIRDEKIVAEAMKGIDAVVHFAAESHVDRSILSAQDFISTNVYGTYVLLQEACKQGVKRFLNIGTDEVYGSIEEGFADENSPLRPSSPYSASKAAQDLMAHAHFTTFGTPVITTRSSNNFGPYQYPEKMIPLFITNALEDKPLPLYGDGLNVRDWLYVEDNCEAIYTVLCKGKIGEIYNIGSGNLLTNIELTKKILKALGKPEPLITPVKDRLGHDKRYALNFEKIKKLGWEPKHNFEKALEATIAWYKTHESWWQKIKEKQREFQVFYSAYYADAAQK
jgi:dTDP-glucose 4,6-dehydratase